MARPVEKVDPDELIVVGLDTADGDDHPLWDPRVKLAVNEDMVKNIAYYGVLKPILVREEAGQKYVVDGRQRVRCAREAKKRQLLAGEGEFRVPVYLIRADDRMAQGIITSANLFRQDDHILDLAFSVVRQLARGQEIDEVALTFGKSVTTIRNWLLVAEADPRVHTAIREGKISFSTGIQVGAEPRAKQIELLEKAIRAGARSNGVLVAPQTTTAKPSNQKGVRRSWARNALKTEAAKALSKERRAVLNWFAYGEVEKGTWMDEFQWAAEAEFEAKREERKRKKAGVSEAPAEDPASNVAPTGLAGADDLPPEVGTQE